MQITRAQKRRQEICLNIPRDLRRSLELTVGCLVGWELLADGRVAITNLSAKLKAVGVQEQRASTRANSLST